MAITIKDVAQLANVAPSTVSRVIANNPRISEKTKVRVRKAMEKLGYHPNFIARSLANQSTKIIGLVLPSSANVFYQNPFFPAVLQGLSEGAHENHYSILLSTGKTEDEIFEGVVNMVQGGMVDGIILMYSRMKDHILTYLQARNFPFVIIGKPYDFAEEITFVANDNVLAAEEATEYLLQLGHEKIGFIGGNLRYVVNQDKLAGYEKALKKSGIVPTLEYTANEDDFDGKEVVSVLLSLETRPTALVISDEVMALSVVYALREMGIRTPEDISVISFNNVPYSEFSTSALTSVDSNIFDLGHRAAKSLIQKLKHGEEPGGIHIPHQLVERNSCRALKKEALAL